MTQPRPEAEHEHETPIVRDRRRIDPVTGELRPESSPAKGPHGDPVGAPAGPAGPAEAAPEAPATEPPAEDGGAKEELERQLAERTADLQRVQAEFVNYRRRVERDRTAVAEQALANVLIGLLPVLDDIQRARAHGELVGGFKSVAEALETTLTKLGLTAYGEAGEPFDPNVHEALMHATAPDVTEPTCTEVLQQGFRLGERVLRPARVAVAEPGDGASAPAGDASSE